MADKHKSITHLKILILLMSESADDRDWDLIDEHLEHVKSYIGNDIAANRATLMQVDLPFGAGSVSVSFAKPAETIFTCTYCQQTGPASEGDKHKCDASELAQLLRDNRCEVCGGYVSGADLVPVLGSDTITVKHKDPALCELPAEGPITDEALMLPDLSPKKLPAYLCFYCGDGFSEKGHFVNHLTTHHGTEEVKIISFWLSIAGVTEPEGTPTVRTQFDDYYKEAAYTALGLGPEKYLWRFAEGAFDLRIEKDMLVPLREGDRWYVMSEPFLVGAKYSCLICGCEFGCDDVEVSAEGDTLCHDCAKPSCAECAEPLTTKPLGKKGKLLCEGCNKKKKADKAAEKKAKKLQNQPEEVVTH